LRKPLKEVQYFSNDNKVDFDFTRCQGSIHEPSYSSNDPKENINIKSQSGRRKRLCTVVDLMKKLDSAAKTLKDIEKDIAD
jgi:hypothetical protein